MAKQDNSVQTLRGFAIILVVMGHVIGYKGDEGMKVADDSFWRYMYYTLEYFRMPLFTVISGWVYTLRPVSKETIGKFIGLSPFGHTLGYGRFTIKEFNILDN